MNLEGKQSHFSPALTGNGSLNEQLPSIPFKIKKLISSAQKRLSALANSTAAYQQRSGRRNLNFLERKHAHLQREKRENETNSLSLPGEVAMAASGVPVVDLCEEATCSICLEYFQDPVIIPECGHNFCRPCLTQCWEKSEGEASCPQCRKTVEQGSIRRNHQLANFVEITKKFSLLGGKKEAEGKGRICEQHQEPLKLFCKEDEAPICLVCDRSKEHKGHEVVPLEEASQEYKNQLSSCLDNMRKGREKILVFKADAEKESQDLLKQMEAERGKMVAEIRRMHQFLEEKEKLFLAQMAEVEKEIAKKREEHMARLSKELSSFEHAIREMEEKLQEPASELLQDIRSFLQRSQEKENVEDPPVAFPPALKWKIWDFCDMNPFLEGVMKKFRDTVEYEHKLQKENITLDRNTAHPFLILSMDRKRVREGKVRQDLPDNPERFDTCGYVLGCESFTAGRHFWEKQIEAEKGKMLAEFRRLHQFLEEQEKPLLAQMSELEKEIEKNREEHMARLSGELLSLESLIREMEEKRRQPVNEQLQDIGSYLQRSQAKEKLENPPVAFPPALKWKIWDFCDINPFLEGVMKQFRDSLGSGLQLRKENVTLDPDTANPWLLLSEDRKSVRRGGARQVLPDKPERFDNYYYVLGREGFTAGRHFWEVAVGSDEGWAVGVAKRSVKRSR